MVDKVLRYVREHHMIEAGDCIVAGISRVRTPSAFC